MNKRTMMLCVGCLLMGLVVPAALRAEDKLIVGIQISPNTIIKSAPVTWVTVHADIAFAAVDKQAVVALDGVVAASIFADDRGELVAKFRFAEITALVSAPQATLTLTGTTITGVAFSGSDTVRVRK